MKTKITAILLSTMLAFSIFSIPSYAVAGPAWWDTFVHHICGRRDPRHARC